MASGKIMGSCVGTNPKAYDFWVEWFSTANPSSNSSTLSVYAYLQRNDGYADSAYDLTLPKTNKYVEVDGKRFYSTEVGIDTTNSKKVLIAKAVSVNIPHEADGTKKVEIYARFYGAGSQSVSSGTVSKSVYLDPVDADPPLFTKQPSIESISQTSATIDFKVDSSNVKMKYRLVDFGEWVEFSDSPLVINGLNPYTNYTVILEAEKSNGKINHSNSLMFKTLPIYAERIVFPEGISVDVGKTEVLPYSVFPENASEKMVEVVSGDDSIIYAEYNRISGMSSGIANLTVKTIDGSNLSYTITAKSVQRVSGISINPSDVTIAKGTQIPLTYLVYPQNADNRSVLLSSSDESVVSISDNEVLGVENGVAIVTITTVDGGFSATCTVNVVGEYTWFDYSEPIEILNTEDIAKIQSNIVTIRTMLLANDYSVDALKPVEARKDTQLIDALAILQNIEYNLDVISDNDAKSIYYVEPKIVGERGSNYHDIWRWIQILNEMYLMLTGAFGKWEYILLNDGYPTIGGKRLLIRGDKIG